MDVRKKYDDKRYAERILSMLDLLSQSDDITKLRLRIKIETIVLNTHLSKETLNELLSQSDTLKDFLSQSKNELIQQILRDRSEDLSKDIYLSKKTVTESLTEATLALSILQKQKATEGEAGYPQKVYWNGKILDLTKLCTLEDLNNLPKNLLKQGTLEKPNFTINVILYSLLLDLLNQLLVLAKQHHANSQNSSNSPSENPYLEAIKSLYLTPFLNSTISMQQLFILAKDAKMISAQEDKEVEAKYIMFELNISKFFPKEVNLNPIYKQYISQMTALVNDSTFLKGENSHPNSGFIGKLFDPEARPTIIGKIKETLKNPDKLNDKALTGKVIEKINEILQKVERGEATHNDSKRTVIFMRMASDVINFNKYIEERNNKNSNEKAPSNKM